MQLPEQQPPSRLQLERSRGVCRSCGKMCDVRYVEDGGAVYLERICPTHGKGRALVAESSTWYQEVLRAPSAPRRPDHTTAGGSGECPTRCGPCAAHAQRCQLPVMSITNACNLSCPICFTFNRGDARWDMTADELDRHLDAIVQRTGGVDLVNLTGGEPTLHPHLFELLARAKRPGIGRVTLNSNGLTIARDPDMARRLADLGVYLIMSLDTLDPETSVRVHGRDITGDKRRALENLERFGVPTTLLMVFIGGVNEHELGPIVDLACNAGFVRSLTIQTMTYTGQGGGTFEPRQHIPVDGVERRIEEATAGKIKRTAFIPLPTAHPLCYGVAYLLLDDAGGRHSLTDLLGPQALARHLVDGYLLQPSQELEDDLRSAIDRLWAEGREPGLLAALRSLLGRLYPPGQRLSVHDRQRRAEQAIKTIYVHAHMDEDTFETGRAMRCPDQVPVDATRMIGACNYNLFYRKSDPRFWVDR